MGVGGTLLGASLCNRRALGIDLSKKFIATYLKANEFLKLKKQNTICGDSLEILKKKEEINNFLQGKKFSLPQYNVVATHGAAHNQEFEVECSIPKLDIQVYGTGGSRRAGEQAAALLALAAVQAALENSPSLPRKSRQRTTQLKLAGIATFQPDAPENKSEDTRKSVKQSRASVQQEQEQESLLPDSDDPTKRVTQSKSA
jgi:hypothetical protein